MNATGLVSCSLTPSGRWRGPEWQEEEAENV
jgi:hypothetical protein